MDILRVNGIEVYAYHGCIDEEALAGGFFTVNTIFKGNFNRAAENDDLDQAIDYVNVAATVKQQMSIRSKLIESVAYRILRALKDEFPIAHEIEVTVIKHRAPIQQPVAEVSFTVSG